MHRTGLLCYERLLRTNEAIKLTLIARTRTNAPSQPSAHARHCIAYIIPVICIKMANKVQSHSTPVIFYIILYEMNQHRTHILMLWEREYFPAAR